MKLQLEQTLCVLFVIVSVGFCRISIGLQDLNTPVMYSSTNSESNIIKTIQRQIPSLQSQKIDQRDTPSKCCNREKSQEEQSNSGPSLPCPREKANNKNAIRSSERKGDELQESLTLRKAALLQTGSPIILDSTQLKDILRELFVEGYGPKLGGVCCKKPSRTQTPTPIPISIPTPTSESEQIASTLTPTIVGGYTKMEQPQNDKGVTEALLFLQKLLSKQVKGIKILQVWSQLVNGMNYKFVFEFLYLQRVTLKYEIVIYAQRDGTMTITSANLIDLPAFSSQQLKKYNNPKGVSEINDIEALLRTAYPQNMAELIEIVQAYVYEPYFVIAFSDKQKAITKITLVYDPIGEVIEIINITREELEDDDLFAKPVLPTDTKPVPPVIPVPPIDTKPVPPAIPVPPIDTKPVPPAIPVPPIDTKPVPPVIPVPPIDTKPVPPVISVPPTPPVISLPPPPIATTTQPSTPTYPIQSFASELDPNQLEQLLKIMAKSKPLNTPFNVIFVNLIRYGARIVVEVKQNYRIFEFIFSFTYSSTDKVLKQIQVLSCRELKSMNDIDPDILSKFHNQDLTNTDKIKRLIQRAFKSIPQISQFRTITRLGVKPSFDGIYYQVLITSLNKHSYELILLWIPDLDFLQIMKYLSLGDIYDITRETVLFELPMGDNMFMIGKNYSLGNLTNFGTRMYQSNITFVSSSSKDASKYYYKYILNDTFRLQFNILVTKTLSFNFTKYELMEDGYLPLNDTSTEAKELAAFAHSYFLDKYKKEIVPVYLMARKITPARIDYRLIYDIPESMVVTISKEPTLSSQNFIVRNIEKLRPQPNSEYFNNRNFTRFRDVSAKEADEDPTYSLLLSLVVKNNNQFAFPNSERVAVFKQFNASGINFKILYRLVNTNQLYLATFYFEFLSQQYKLISLELYERKVQVGDYQWKCTQNDKTTKFCLTCQNNNYLLFLGRCYARLVGCQIQIGSTCLACQNSYFFGTEGVCILKKKYPSWGSIMPQRKSSGGPLRYAHLPEVVSGCMVWQGSICVGCQPRNHPSNGICVAVDYRCGDYQPLSGACITCISGFYQNYQNPRMQCLALSVGCEAANEIGECLSCTANYDLAAGKCESKVVKPPTTKVTNVRPFRAP